MTQNWKTGLTVAFIRKCTFPFSALALVCGLGPGLDTCGLVNIPAAWCKYTLSEAVRETEDRGTEKNTDVITRLNDYN